MLLTPSLLLLHLTTLGGGGKLSNGGQPSPAADDTSLVVLILHIIDGNSPIYHSHSQLTGVVGWKIQASDRVVTVDESIRPLQKERMTTSVK